jgi:hypothetical protein
MQHRQKCMREPAAQHGLRAGGCGFLDPELQRPGQAHRSARRNGDSRASRFQRNLSGRSQNRRVEVKVLVKRGLAGER